MRVQRVAVFLLSCICLWAQPTVLYEGASANMSFRAILVDRESFTKQEMERFAKEFIGRESNRTLAKLVVFTERDDAVTTLFGKGMPNVGYRSWETHFRTYARRVPAMGDVIVVRGSGVLRYRDASGRVERIVFSPPDPLKIRLDGTVFEIVDVAFPSFPPLSQDVRNPEVEFCIKTSASLEKEQGLHLTKMLSDKLVLETLTVYARNDLWFIDATSFPFYFRFTADLTPPTIQDYYASEELLCVLNRLQFTCDKYHPVDEAGKHPNFRQR